jgi:hypothetical protein
MGYTKIKYIALALIKLCSTPNKFRPGYIEKLKKKKKKKKKSK